MQWDINTKASSDAFVFVNIAKAANTESGGLNHCLIKSFKGRIEISSLISKDVVRTISSDSGKESGMNIVANEYRQRHSDFVP